MNTPVKLNTIDARTINGFDIELNWNTSNKMISAIPVRRAPDKNSWFSDCCLISPVNLYSTPCGASYPDKAISAVFTISFALDPASIDEYKVTTLWRSICLIALNDVIFFWSTIDAIGTSFVLPVDWSLKTIFWLIIELISFLNSSSNLTLIS